MNPVQKILLKKIQKELPGFNQNRYRFYNTNSNFIKVIEVQFLNLINEKKSFTIHYGIYVPILYKILWDQTKPKSIEASECLLFCNINSILTGFKGKPAVKYWDLDLENLESTYNEIINVIKDVVFPFSKQINSLEELNLFINSTEFPGKYVATYPILNVVLKYVLGKKVEAEALINELKKLNPDYFNPEIEKMNKKLADHGINLN